MKKRFTLLFLAFAITQLYAQQVSVKWDLSDKDNLSNNTVTGDESITSLLTTSFQLGAKLDSTTTMSASAAETGYEKVTYTPAFTTFIPATRVTSKTSGHCVRVCIAPQSGHTFKPTSISFDAAKVGTDGGNVDVYYQIATNNDIAIATTLSPLRNKITATNSVGYTSYQYSLGDVICDGQPFYLYLYIYNLNGTDNTNPKAIGLRNVQIDGAVDEAIFTASKFIESFTCKGTTTYGQEMQTIDLYDGVKDLKNGGLYTYPNKVYGAPTDFIPAMKEGYYSNVTMSNNVAIVDIFDATGAKVFYFEVYFTITNRQPKPAATPLKRGLMSLNLSSSGGSGNLVSWRSRANDDKNLKFKLWKGTNATTQKTKVNSGSFIMGKTNFLDTSGSASNYYRLEVFDAQGNLIEEDVSDKTWSNQTNYINIGNAPVDTKNGAKYTPNDASYCDMDGDGEYEIILKWSPTNEKDAASSGTTSDPYFDCYKLDGTRLWRICLGPNFFTSAHTIQFIAWDLDGDGYGEFMCKTGPGTVDGEGNYVTLNGDDPTANWLNGRGKQVEGPEYITVFDGMTGAELSTIPYHTDYAAGASYWGDSNQNRSERYLAAIAWLDGEDKNPSPIFARGYYSGAFVGAYDFDGATLKERWVSRNTTSGKGLWGEGAHWISVADVDEDGKQEIVYGSACLDHDGSLLYRTGLEHGDALHVGDFDTERDGLEVFMVHEHSPFGMDLRDAKTGQLLLHKTASSDTGRGICAHFDPNNDNAYWQFSASSSLFNIKGDSINNISHGGGASLNNRIYWNGDLADEFYDKSVLEAYNNGLNRIQVNGGNYTIGHLNNATKNNPDILGDILGDWREEIINWTTNDSITFQLIINATSYQTDYQVPHLMDNYAYRAQVINQNCAYNQPPHLSYDLIKAYTITRNFTEVDANIEIDNAGTKLGKYWDCFYTTYPVKLPAGVTAWSITGYNNNADTVKLTKITGTNIPANCGVLINSTEPTGKFRPTTNATSTVSTTYLKGSYCDSTLVCTTTYNFYKFKNGEKGLGFYLADGETVEGGTGFLRVTNSSSTEPVDAYILGYNINPTLPTDIKSISAEQKSVVYDINGTKVSKPTKSGVYIINGKKVFVK